MKIKLTKASSKDKKPTINTKKLSSVLTTDKVLMRLKVNKKECTTVWHKSRGGKTLYPDSWDSTWPMPHVGNSVEAELMSIILLK